MAARGSPAQDRHLGGLAGDLDGRRAVVLARLDHPVARTLLGQQVPAVGVERLRQRLLDVGAPHAGETGFADGPIEAPQVDGRGVDAEPVGVTLAHDEATAVRAERLDEEAAHGRHRDLQAARRGLGVRLRPERRADHLAMDGRARVDREEAEQ